MVLDRPILRHSPAPLALAIVVAACGDGPTPPSGDLFFGQVGEVFVEVTTPLEFGSGTLDQSIRWSSDGSWVLEESVAYEGVTGDANVRPIEGDAETFAGLYALWVEQVNSVAGLDLFVDELDPGLNPACSIDQSTLTLTLRDDVRRESVTWRRCGEGPLETLSTLNSGPDPSAPRVFSAAVGVRNSTVRIEDPDFTSAYTGTIPFATIDRGEVSPAALSTPRVFRDAEAFADFWADHAGGPVPAVDFDTEQVFVAAVGTRDEAGTTVEIRRVLPVQSGTFIEAVELVPGDFCSPAGVRRTPFHIVVAPHVPEPIRFSDVQVQRIPCG